MVGNVEFRTRLSRSARSSTLRTGSSPHPLCRPCSRSQGYSNHPRSRRIPYLGAAPLTMPLVFAFFRRVLPLFAPSLLLGLLGGVLLLLRPLPYKRQADIVIIVALGVALAIALVAGARVLERLLPSYRFAQQQMERALRPLRLTRPQALLLAAVTSVAEELFFRGALLPLIGVWGQALAVRIAAPRHPSWLELQRLHRSRRTDLRLHYAADREPMGSRSSSLPDQHPGVLRIAEAVEAPLPTPEQLTAQPKNAQILSTARASTSGSRTSAKRT